jgi:uncharacterized protein related to proFAR isomerase
MAPAELIEPLQTKHAKVVKKMDLDALKRKGEEVEKNTRVIPFQEDRVI